MQIRYPGGYKVPDKDMCKHFIFLLIIIILLIIKQFSSRL